MSRHSTHRFNLIHQAIAVALFGASSLTAHAVTLGQANINSTQHEPLSATINVSDIDADNFSASIGDASMYQQMGLSQDANIQVQFIPTSDTTGQLVLSSNAPISTPFTDVVLSINDNGNHVVKPQTLLMPLPKNNAISSDLSTPVMVASNHEQNLPIVSGDLVEYGEPLALQNSAPPPLFGDDNDELLASGYNDYQTDNSSQFGSNTNTQLDLLSRQVTFGLNPTNPNGEESPITPEELLKLQQTQNLAQNTPSKAPTQAPSSVADTSDIDTQDSHGAVYVVQNGDNLWSIANEIAKANNMNLTEVMEALHQQNPDAFNHGKMNQLKANATLSIPNYTVIPSQKAIQDAIAARQSSRKDTTARSSSNAAKNTQAKRNTNRSTRSESVARALPKPQMTLVTPSQSGSATGSQTQNTQAKSTTSGSGGNNTSNTLQSTRQQTASNARRVNSLNQELSSATQRLQLQNERLAELEARLKALREQ